MTQYITVSLADGTLVKKRIPLSVHSMDGAAMDNRGNSANKEYVEAHKRGREK